MLLPFTQSGLSLIVASHMLLPQSRWPLTHSGLSGNTAKRLALGKGKKATYRAEKKAAKGEVVEEAATNKTPAGPQDCDDPWSLSSKVWTQLISVYTCATALRVSVCIPVYLCAVCISFYLCISVTVCISVYQCVCLAVVSNLHFLKSQLNLPQCLTSSLSSACAQMICFSTLIVPSLCSAQSAL